MTVLGAVFVLVIGFGLWFHALDTNPTIVIPTPVLPANNAYNFYKAAAEAIIDTGKIDWAVQNRRKATPGAFPGGRVPTTTNDRPYSLQEREALVAENSAALQLLHTGFHYPFQHPPLRSFSATFPEYQKERALARLLALEAQVDAQKGDWNGALNADLDAVQLGETMPRGGSLIGMLVGDACQSIGRRGAWEAAGHLDAKGAKAEAQRLERIRACHVPMSDILQEEKWFFQAGLLEMMERRDWPGSLVGMAVGNTDTDGGLSISNWERWGQGAHIRLTGKRRIMANYTRYMDQSIANVQKPYAAHLADPMIPDGLIGAMLQPSYSSERFREVETHTQNALLLVTLALQAYQRDHAAYPATLSLLAPSYLHAIPEDPFAPAGPLHYKRLGSRYLLCSIGPDGKDDGGRAIFHPERSAPANPSDIDRRRIAEEGSLGDIVAGVNIP